MADHTSDENLILKKMKLIVLFIAAGFAHSAIADVQWVVGAGAGIISTSYKQYQEILFLFR